MTASAPCRTATSQLLLRRGGGEHARAQHLAQLHRRQADAARRSQHQKRLAGRNRRSRHQAVIGGRVRDQKRGAVGEGKARRQRPDPARRHHGLLGIAAGAHLRDGLVAHGDAAHIRRHLRDDAGGLDARHERQLGAMLVEPLDGQHIGEIDAGSLQRDAHGAGAERSARQAAQLQLARRPQLLADNGTVGGLGHFPFLRRLAACAQSGAGLAAPRSAVISPARPLGAVQNNPCQDRCQRQQKVECNRCSPRPIRAP